MRQETLPLRFVIFRPLKTTYKLNAIDDSLHTGVYIFVLPESRDAGTAHELSYSLDELRLKPSHYIRHCVHHKWSCNWQLAASGHSDV